MKFYVVIPAHNEAKFIKLTLNSLVTQTSIPHKVVVVNDNSSDNTAEIVEKYASKYSFISLVNADSNQTHMPGSKVIKAFYEGYHTLDSNYDVICKMDADLIFPSNYFESLATHFNTDPTIGMVGGFCYIEKQGDWILENLTNRDHIRGALKAYRKECFQAIGQLKVAMGWDTVDELLAAYHGWQIKTDEALKVKHLKPTGNNYNKKAQNKQGEAFYKLRYGWILTMIASLKLALRKKNSQLFVAYLKGYQTAQKNQVDFLVDADQGRFIRALRWRKIRAKLF